MIDLRTFQEENQSRAIAAFPPQCMTLEFLAIAIAGEAGEMCNLVRRNYPTWREVMIERRRENGERVEVK